MQSDGEGPVDNQLQYSLCKSRRRWFHVGHEKKNEKNETAETGEDFHDAPVSSLLKIDRCSQLHTIIPTVTNACTHTCTRQRLAMCNPIRCLDHTAKKPREPFLHQTKNLLPSKPPIRVHRSPQVDRDACFCTSFCVVVL